MSSSIDNITCPKCGGPAQREVNHKTGEVIDHCNTCDYEEVITEAETVSEFNKITVGFVIQTYKKQGDDFVCVNQDFICGDDVTYENEMGEVLAEKPDEQYQSFDMVQPGWDFYFLYVYAGVDVKKIGPFPTEQERDDAIENHRQEGREDYDSYFPFDVTRNVKVHF